MGLGFSRARSAESRQRRVPLPSSVYPRRSSFSRRLPTAETIETTVHVPSAPHHGMVVPSYPLFPPMIPAAPVRYNNYLPAPTPYIAQPPMMYMVPAPPRAGAPAPYPMLPPTPQVAPMPGPVGVYSALPGRLLTDWTGGGKISPGFLGPPI